MYVTNKEDTQVSSSLIFCIILIFRFILILRFKCLIYH